MYAASTMAAIRDVILTKLYMQECRTQTEDGGYAVEAPLVVVVQVYSPQVAISKITAARLLITTLIWKNCSPFLGKKYRG
jgi:hypothetical protein